MIDRSSMPAIGGLKDVLFPPFREYTHDSGLKSLFIKDNRFPVITCRLLVKSGSYCDFFRKGKSGLATLTAEMLNKGTFKKNNDEITRLIDFNGALISTGAGYDASYISFSCLKKNFDVMFGLVSELVGESVFPEDELTQKRNQIISSLISIQDEGAYLAERAFYSALYEGTPYETDPDGTPDSLKNIKRDDVVEFKNENYVPLNMILCVVGDFDEDKVIKAADMNFTGGDKKIPVNGFEFQGKHLGIRVYIAEKKDARQASLHIGHAGIHRGHPDFVKTMFLNALFGGMFTSRINKNLREEKGLTYGARTSFNCLKHSGDFSVETEVNGDKSGLAVREIIKEMNDMRENPVSNKELESAKSYISGNFPLQLETSNSVAGKLLSLELYGAKKDFYDHYLSTINSLTADDVTETARKYFRPDELIIAAAGSRLDLTEQLKEFGDSEFIDKVK